MRKQWLGLAGWLLLCFAAAAAGGTASRNAASFYGQLALPSWAPPAWLFAPVWSLLYLMMAFAAWLVWPARGFAGTRMALALFVIQLIPNALWTWLFFEWHLGAAALADAIVMWLLVLATMTSFWRIKPLAGALLLPYLLWVSFAVALTLAVWRANPALLG
ncbi:MAG: TspO/MBR family protein [Janthinobacterium lividum]